MADRGRNHPIVRRRVRVRGGRPGGRPRGSALRIPCARWKQGAANIESVVTAVEILGDFVDVPFRLLQTLGIRPPANLLHDLFDGLRAPIYAQMDGVVMTAQAMGEIEQAPPIGILLPLVIQCSARMGQSRRHEYQHHALKVRRHRDALRHAR